MELGAIVAEFAELASDSDCRRLRCAVAAERSEGRATHRERGDSRAKRVPSDNRQSAAVCAPPRLAAGWSSGKQAGPGQEDITTMGSFRGLAGCRLGNDGRRRGFSAWFAESRTTLCAMRHDQTQKSQLASIANTPAQTAKTASRCRHWGCCATQEASGIDMKTACRTCGNDVHRGCERRQDAEDSSQDGRRGLHRATRRRSGLLASRCDTAGRARLQQVNQLINRLVGLCISNRRHIK